MVCFDQLFLSPQVTSTAKNGISLQSTWKWERIIHFSSVNSLLNFKEGTPSNNPQISVKSNQLTNFHSPWVAFLWCPSQLRWVRRCLQLVQHAKKTHHGVQWMHCHSVKRPSTDPKGCFLRRANTEFAWHKAKRVMNFGRWNEEYMKNQIIKIIISRLATFFEARKITTTWTLQKSH